MTEVSKLTPAKAKADPDAVFACPQQVVDEILLTRGEKIATLKRWRTELEAELRASAEGMQPEQPSTEKAAKLQKIGELLSTLSEPEPVK